ncbi:elongation factor G-like protein EF-G2 [Nocardia salmonicida]|uniref:elongation factor G-like protein EF-G2 n=1 Tax=Nocardia salmonicida TaxID=53431 RepID=UPI0033C644AE
MVDRTNEAQRPESIRNVALVGSSGAGKTTLVEALALATGTVNRAGRVEDGTSLSDYDEVERRQHRSVQVSVVPVTWGGVKINLIDTPGCPDFVGELRAGLRAADAALFLVSAADGVEGVAGPTRDLWDECARVGMPRAIVMTHLDTARAEYAELVQTCQALLTGGVGDTVLPLHLPVYGQETPDGHRPAIGLLELLERRVADYRSGKRVRTVPSAEQLAVIDPARDRLIEAIIAEAEDETLMDRYLDGEPVELDTLVDDLERAVARASFYPVLFAAPPAEEAEQGLGTLELLELVTAGFPTPIEHPLSAVPRGNCDGAAPTALRCDPAAELAAEVIRTSSDPYVGRVSLVRVFSGTLHSEDTIRVCGPEHDADDRVGGVTAPLGKQQRTLTEAVAGDIALVSKLGHAETGDTLSGTERPLLIKPWQLPEPLLPVAIRAQGRADEDKLSQALTRLVAEDPTLRPENNEHTHQLVLWCLGEAHRDLALERLRGRFGVRVEMEMHRVALRETLAAEAEGHGRLVKQSGGHGQYAVCHIQVEPLAEGTGFEFVDRVIGGVVPRQFIGSVEKGARAQAARGVTPGYPLVDVRVTLREGKAHSVDSSDAAFQTAGALALRDAAAASGTLLLEPVAAVRVTVPDDNLGAVLGDLSARRGRILGTEPADTGVTQIRAEVPELELSRYVIDLRSLTHGAGSFARGYLRHEPMPTAVAERAREEIAEASA